jgi:hypothetical protein
MACTIPVRDVTKVNNVIGIGMTLHKFNTRGLPVYLPCVSYHLLQMDVRLFSPHTYHQMHGGYSKVYGDCIKMLLNTSEIQIQILREKHYLPIVFDSYVSPKVKKTLASSMHSGLCHTQLNAFDFFQENTLQDLQICVPLGITGPKHYLHFCGPCIGASEYGNLPAPQKELLKWHWKLGISMYCVQEMMREQHYEEPNGNKTVLPAIIKPKLASARNFIVPPCQSCLLAHARKCTPNVLWMHLLDNREGAIMRDQYNVGDFISTDQFICKTPRRLLTGYGRESQDCHFQGGTIFNDTPSGLIWVENQVSLGANKMVMGKTRFEQWLYDQCVCEVKHYHGDNGIFSTEEFWRDCEDKRQSQLFSGIGIQHQNAHTERAIQTIMYMARTFMVHASLHWTESLR